MNIQLFGLTLPGFPWWPLILWGIVWLAMLYHILTREDLDTLQKILWVLVVVFVPVFGVPLYLVAAPASPVDFSGPVVRGSEPPGPRTPAIPPTSKPFFFSLRPHRFALFEAAARCNFRPADVPQ